MKERTFYVINLDNKRIGVILALLSIMLTSFFLLGMSVGKKKAMTQTEKSEGMELVSEKYELPGLEKKEEIVKNEDPNSQKQTDHEKKAVEMVELKPANSEKFKINNDKISASFPDSDSSPAITKKANIKKSKKIKMNESSTISTEVFTVQLGAFRNKKEASTLKKELIRAKKGLNPYIQKEGAYYCVRVGKSKDKKELKKIIARLGQSFQSSAMIIRSKKA